MARLEIAPAAERYFKKVREPGLRRAYFEALGRIAAAPLSGNRKRGDLRGLWGYDVYYKGTNYEIAYRIVEEGDPIVVVVLAGSRENFYDQLKRHLG